MNIFEEIKKPFNIITLIIAILSIFLTCIFYFKSLKEKKPTYIISEKYKIYDSKISSPKIKVVANNVESINTDIYVVEIKFWNSGQLPVEPSDIREPVKIVISPCKKILDYKVIEQTHPNILDIKLTENSEIKQSDLDQELIISWKHLDPNFGARFQIIYSSDTNHSINFKGHILGIDSFLDGRPLTKRFSWLDAIISAIIGGSATISIILIVGLIQTNIKKQSENEDKNKIELIRKKRKLEFIWCTIIIVFLTIINSILYLVFLKGIHQPFK